MTKQYFLLVLILLITTPYVMAMPYNRRDFLKNHGRMIYLGGSSPTIDSASAEAAQVNQVELTALNADEAAAN
ncbi:2749_t:CDS:1, partial [Gigaspora margarita]